MVTISATPNTGYNFSAWTGEVQNVADPIASTTTITVTNDATFTAKFDPKNYTVIAAPAGTNSHPTMKISAPSPGQTLATTDVRVTFATDNWSVGGKGDTHLHFHLDSNPDPLMFYNGSDNVVEFGTQSGPTPIATWIDSNTIQFNNLTDGYHTVRLYLATASHLSPGNSEAEITLALIVDASASNTQPTIHVQSPSAGATVGPDITIVYDTPNSTVSGKGGTHLSVQIDGNTDILNVYQWD